jgi:hypothetical protein
MESNPETQSKSEEPKNPESIKTEPEEYDVMHYCNSCGAYYDGFAQCCFELNHDIYKVNKETREVIAKI